MLVPIAVEIVQRGLTVIRGHEILNGTPEPIPSPGAIDGLWGDRTRVSFLAMLNRIYERQIPREQYTTLQSTAPRARIVQVDMNVFALLNDASAEMPARSPRPATPASSPLIPTSAILAPTEIPPWVLPTVLGLGMAAVVIGGGYWLYTRRSRRRGRR